MDWQRRVLVLALAVLLPAGVLSAATVDRGAGPGQTVAAGGGRATPAGLGEPGLLDEEAPAVTVAPATTIVPPAAPATATTSTKPSTASTTSTTAPSAAATTTTVAKKTVPPGNLAPATSWEAKAEGVSARVRIEPAAPVAGQPIKFFVDVWGVNACCDVTLRFDDSNQFLVNLPRRCEDPSPLKPGPLSAVTTHTYPTPGAYRLYFQTLDGDVCTFHPTAGEPFPGHHVSFDMCIAVGPGDVGDAGCPPRPKPF